MKNKNIEKQIFESFEDRKPELFNKILESCPKMNEIEARTSFWIKLKNIFSGKRFAYSFTSLAFVLVLSLILFYSPNVVNPQAFSVIAIDVNPSVVLELDEEGKVINVILNNTDAENIVGDLDLIGVDYNVAVNALIGSMVLNGYISELTNSVLLSISSNDKVRESELMTELSQAINDLLTGNSINGSVIIQELNFEEDAEALAALLNISEAKAELILDIIEVDPRLTKESLAQLSINDLNLLLEAKNYALDNVEKTGSASSLGIISIEEAYQAALTELNVVKLDVLEFKIELEQEDGTMVYQVKVETETDTFKVLIDATEGTVFNETDKDDDNEDKDDVETNFPTDALTEEEVLAEVLRQLGINIILITELEIEKDIDNGVAYYEIEFEYNGQEYELEVDAVSVEFYSNSMDESGFDHHDDKDQDDDDDDDDDDDAKEKDEEDPNDDEPDDD